jgi:hypothetical protein
LPQPPKARALPRIGYRGGLSGDAVWVEVGLALNGLAPILRRKLGQSKKSVMKVVTLKNIPEVPAPRAAESTDGYSGPVPAMR